MLAPSAMRQAANTKLFDVMVKTPVVMAAPGLTWSAPHRESRGGRIPAHRREIGERLDRIQLIGDRREEAAAAMRAGMLSHTHEVSASAEVVAGLKVWLYWTD